MLTVLKGISAAKSNRPFTLGTKSNRDDGEDRSVIFGSFLAVVNESQRDTNNLNIRCSLAGAVVLREALSTRGVVLESTDEGSYLTGVAG